MLNKQNHRRGLRCVMASAVLFQQILFAPLVKSGYVQAADNGVVVGGQANIVQNGVNLDVTTLTDRTIINWDKFNIPQGQTANFFQPGSNSAVLNRVITSNNPSAIYGNLFSNGNVFLVNPSGVVIGPSGVINTNGFTASVLDITNQDFLNGNLNFQGDSRATILNQGRIHTKNGGATLIGGEVINEGLIESDGGNINLLTGGSVQLKGGGTYTQADQQTLLNGISETAGLIRNSGALRATGALEVGGEVYLVSPAGTVIQEAVVAASKKDASGNLHGGNVVVDAGQGTATVTGEISVNGQTGGSVSITGEQVQLQGASINANGDHDGGNVRIGGGFQGKDTSISNSQSTTVDSATTINANSLLTGDGGNVILWSDGNTLFEGSIYAKGSVLGEGGFVEVSGKQELNFLGHVNTGGGTLLLDPTNFMIVAGNGNQTTNSIGAAKLVELLEAGTNNVTLQTSSAGAQDGDIYVNAQVLYSSQYDLTFLAHGDIFFIASVQNSAPEGNAGDINIVAGWDGTTTDMNTFKSYVSQNIGAATQFGNYDGKYFATGSVYIGGASRTTGVAVGSANGETNLFANDLFLQGSTNVGSANAAYAQLGYRHIYSTGPDDVTMATGDINVALRGNLSATAGDKGIYAWDSENSYVQIGHGGNRRAETQKLFE